MKTLACMLILFSLPVRGAIVVQRDATGAMVYSNVPMAMTVLGPAKAAPAPQLHHFPVIARAEQQQRDRARLAILHDELDSEQQHLRQARGAGAAPDIQHRHLSNIAALQREIAALR